MGKEEKPDRKNEVSIAVGFSVKMDHRFDSRRRKGPGR